MILYLLNHAHRALCSVSFFQYLVGQTVSLEIGRKNCKLLQQFNNLVFYSRASIERQKEGQTDYFFLKNSLQRSKLCLSNVKNIISYYFMSLGQTGMCGLKQESHMKKVFLSEFNLKKKVIITYSRYSLNWISF